MIEGALTARFWAWVDEQRLASSQEQDGDGRWTRYVAGSPDRIDGMRRCDGVGLDELDESKRQQLAGGRGRTTLRHPLGTAVTCPCALSPAGAGRLDVATDANTPSGSSPLPGPETRVLTFHHNCKAGSEVQLWTVEGAGHVPAFAAGFARDLVDFLL